MTPPTIQTSLPTVYRRADLRAIPIFHDTQDGQGNLPGPA